MGWQEKITSAAGKLAGEASKNQDSIERGIDKVAKIADEKTGARYSEHIRKGGEELRSGLSRLTGPGGGEDKPR
jgi:hypothetical protein